MNPFLLLTVGTCIWLVPAVTLAERRPNIVLLLTDDQRPDTIAALGNPVIRTPSLDRLVREGTTFTMAHAAYPLCVPSRAEILTGTSGFANGIMPPYENQLNPNVALWPMTMRDAGYETWYVGKWHTTGRPRTRGYTESLGLFSSGGSSYWKEQVDFKGTPITGYKGWVFQTDDRTLFPERGVGLTANISAEFADAAIQLIRRRPERPFFMHVNFTAPHDPLIIPPGYEKAYDPDRMPLPANYLPQHPFDHGNYDGRDEHMLPWPRTEQAVRHNLAGYYAVISHMDQQIGRIFDALQETGQSENTVVIFSSDHGLAVGSHGLMGKQNMYEHTVIVPLIFSGPGIPRGQQRDALVYLRDLFPTACDLAGLRVPTSVEGRSLLPIIRGERDQLYERIFCYFSDVQRMVRDQQWKLVHYPKIDRYQLFDLSNDPSEMNDLSSDQRHAAKLAELRTHLESWQRYVNDPAL